MQSAQPNEKALGDLPEWNLSDLYPAPDAPALAKDFEGASRDCSAFSAEYRGKLAEIASGAGAARKLYEAVRRYEALEDLLGRIMAYASLLHAGDVTDPARGKFYADTRDNIVSASTQLLFFQLELNRLDDALLDRLAQEAPLSHYRPWLEDIRKEKPHELEEKIEELFHEKSTTGSSSWNRLFDETIASLRFSVAGEELSIEQTLNLMQDARRETRRDAALA
ncbi:MAG TPA: oligoendopeptidase F, partial [Methylocystis sp.]|nr:oligoendopeptidase F [Methylocystis sp.]